MRKIKQIKALAFGPSAFFLCIASVVLSGCGGGQATSAALAPGDLTSQALVRQPARPRLARPSRSGQRYLYVGVGPPGFVYVYTYPQGKLVGKITGLIGPEYECADSAGDVFIPSTPARSSPSTIYEYTNGGTTPVATLSDPGEATSCSFDPTTGDLAVANGNDDSNPYGYYGDVAIYAGAQGNPTMYYSSQYYFFSCGYDSQGNLYLGTSEPPSDQAGLIRLANGSSSFEQMKLDVKIYAIYALLPSIQWDGRHMTVSTHAEFGRSPIYVYRLAISGSSAKVVGTTKLERKHNDHREQSWIQGNTIIGIYYHKGYGNIAFWPYPKGGITSKGITKVAPGNQYELSGLTVSAAASR
jgi:hypothetical protein